MPKIDNRIEILPDIEMYGGSNDKWIIRLCDENGYRYTYNSLQNKNCSFTLVIADFNYIHRTSGSAGFSLTKAGTLGKDTDEVSATATFTLAPNDTIQAYGKFVYQIEMVCSGVRQIAQGNLFIRKNISQ